jgi:hypothetical protein
VISSLTRTFHHPAKIHVLEGMWLDKDRAR